MSRASEYKAEYKKLIDRRPESPYPGAMLLSDSGNIILMRTGDLDPSAALALGKWLVETFGEEEPKP